MMLIFLTCCECEWFTYLAAACRVEQRASPSMAAVRRRCCHNTTLMPNLGVCLDKWRLYCWFYCLNSDGIPGTFVKHHRTCCCVTTRATVRSLKPLLSLMIWIAPSSSRLAFKSNERVRHPTAQACNHGSQQVSEMSQGRSQLLHCSTNEVTRALISCGYRL